jgi:hypothetical protein
MDQLIDLFNNVVRIFSILAITSIMFYVHPLISSIIIILYEIWYNINIITLDHIDVPQNFTNHMIILFTFVVIEYMIYMYSSYAILLFTLIKINYFFVKTSLASYIYDLDRIIE